MRKKKKHTLTTQGDAFVAIAELSPEALKVTADVMEQANERTVEILERQLQAEIADHNETRRRLNVAHRRFDVMQARILWLAGNEFPDETIDEIEDVLRQRPE